MDNILEILIPLIFAAIYFFGNMFSGKSEDKSAPSQAPRRQSEDQEADVIERQRRIQEEIRRKIMERRRAAEDPPLGTPSSSSAATENPTDRQLRERREAVQRRRAERKQLKQGSAGASRTAPAELAENASAPDSHPGTSRHSPEWAETESPANPYETQMQARLKQIEATKRRAEKLQKQVGTTPLQPSKTSQLNTRHSPLPRSSVRSTLRNPAAARAAFIYAEVLGQPISQRKQSPVPGLSS